MGNFWSSECRIEFIQILPSRDKRKQSKMKDGRKQEEDRSGSHPLHHHSTWCPPRHIGAAILWLAINLWDL